MRVASLLFSLAAATLVSLSLGCSATAERPAPSTERTDADGYGAFVDADVIWKTTDIPVCWDNPGDDAAEREWVRQSIAATWEVASWVRFTGWDKCGSGAG